MILRARLASEPYFDQESLRCDCFLLNPDSDTQAEPPALVQLISWLREPIPAGWKAGDILQLQPTISCSWNDVQETGRCYVHLAITVTCEGRQGFLIGMIPINPDLSESNV